MLNVSGFLRPFGITKCYKGFDHVCYSIRLAVVQETRLEAIVKEIYMETASHFSCTWFSVERNIRTVVARAWMINPDLLTEMAGYPLSSQPTVSEFIEIVSSYILRSSPIIQEQQF